jgi:tRNA pseudouridine13 synthase
MVSVPARAEQHLPKIDGAGIRLLRVPGRHGNKLKPGHLRGNTFRILVRDPDPAAGGRLPALLERLRRQGLPNGYGSQRFGRDGETVYLGLSLLGSPAADGYKGVVRSNPFLRKLALSAAQAALFNHVLGRRLTDGLLRRALTGDVMAKWPFGGLFVARDLATEQERLEAREIVPAGPIFGRKMFGAEGEAARRESAALEAAGLTPASFQGFGKLVQGTRRHNLIYLDDLSAIVESEGVRLHFTLPAGTYATILLRELMHIEVRDNDSAGEDGPNEC